MRQIKLQIDKQIINQYPDIAIGYSFFTNLKGVAAKPLPQELKALANNSIRENNITLQNLVEHPAIKAWREIYQKCSVKPKTYKSSIESLVRRVVKDDLKSIHTVVDVYNLVSIYSLLPMGGYNVDELESLLTLRFGRDNDRFVSLSGDPIEVKQEHIVYADEKEVVCWMWNHKDCKRTMLHPDTDSGVFIIDSVRDIDLPRVKTTLIILKDTLVKLGAIHLSAGILTKNDPEESISI